MATTSRYSKSMSKDDIKRLSKEVSLAFLGLQMVANVSLKVTKKLVRGDFKANRVKDPTAPISSKHEKTVKNYVKDFMDKAVKKKTEREKDKGSQNGTGLNGDITVPTATETPETPRFAGYNAEAPPVGSSGAELKRKREEDGEPASPKKSRTHAQPAPPPPPPPTDDMHMTGEGSSLTPMDDDPVSVHSTSDVGANGMRAKKLEHLASPTQLATPPSKDHNDYHQHAVATESRH